MADLIVPTAPNQGGRAAQIRVSGESAGGAVAQFGQTLFNTGMKIRDERDARELSQARIDMQMQLGQLRQEFNNVSDPTALNEGFPARIAQTRAELIGGLNERLQPRAGMAFDELANRHTLAIGARATDLHQSTLRANLATARNVAIANAPGTDEDTRNSTVTTFSETVVDAVTTGALTPEQAGAAVESFTSEQALTAANSRLVDDPAGLAEALRAGEYAGISGTQRPALLARAEAAAAKVAAQAGREADAIANNQLGLVITAANQGRIAANEIDILDTPEFRDNPKYGEALAAVHLRDARPDMAQMTPDQLREAIAEERGKTVANGYDNNRLEAMQNILKEAEKGWRDDPIAQAQAVGLPAPAAPPDLANADEQTLVQFFANRASFAEGLVQDGYTDSPVFFSAEERDQITALTTPDQPPAERVKIAALLTAGFGDNAHQALANLGADTVFAHFAGLIASNGNPNSAEMAFRGQQAIEAGNIKTPTDAEARDIIRTTLAPQFRGVLGADETIKNLMDVTTAVYADMARNEAEFDPELFKQALNLSLGQAGTASNNPTGGFGDVNGESTILPIGLSAGEVQNALIFVESQFRRERLGDTGPNPTELITAAGLNGTAPMYGGNPIGENEMDALTMQAVGDGKYLLFYKGHEITAGDTAESFILDIRRLIDLTNEAGNTPFDASSP